MDSFDVNMFLHDIDDELVECVHFMNSVCVKYQDIIDKLTAKYKKIEREIIELTKQNNEQNEKDIEDLDLCKGKIEYYIDYYQEFLDKLNELY